MRKNIVERGRPQMTVWRMGIARSVPTATHTRSQYVLLIAFPQQCCPNAPQCSIIRTFLVSFHFKSLWQYSILATTGLFCTPFGHFVLAPPLDNRGCNLILLQFLVLSFRCVVNRHLFLLSDRTQHLQRDAFFYPVHVCTWWWRIQTAETCCRR